MLNNLYIVLLDPFSTAIPNFLDLMDHKWSLDHWLVTAALEV